jgi:rubrerythrin
MLFAERARQRGNADFAHLLEKTAKEELLEHFVEEAGLTRLMPVMPAIQGEAYEIETMYRYVAEQAFSAATKRFGDPFDEIRHDEMKHRDLFKQGLREVKGESTSRMATEHDLCGSRSYIAVQGGE